MQTRRKQFQDIKNTKMKLIFQNKKNLKSSSKKIHEGIQNEWESILGGHAATFYTHDNLKSV